MPRQKAGKSRNSETTKDLILAAARERFAADGYERATIRAIAEGAEIDPALVMRYFGNNTFGLDFDPTLRLTFDVANGKVTGGKLVQRGMAMNVFRRP